MGTMNVAEQGVEEGEKGLLTVIPDANVLIHGKSLSDLPWSELGRSAIEVVFVPPMIRELDKLKNQTGRPNKIARQLSSDIRALIYTPSRRAELRKSQPAVSKRVELQSVTGVLNATLRLDHADQALINYALQLRQNGSDVLLLTDDTICGTTAQEVGLATHFLPDHWLREPEPDESGKENAKLRAEIQRLSSAEPKVLLSFRDRADNPLERLEASVTRWPALSEAELDNLMMDVRQRCPQATSFERQQPRSALERLWQMSALTAPSVYEPATEKEVELYNTIEYPNWLNSMRKTLESLHLRLAARTHWPAVVAVADNAGTRPATETIIRIRVRGAFAILSDSEESADQESDGKASDRPELPLPPTPPRGRVKTIDFLGGYRDLGTDAFPKAPPVIPPDFARFARPELRNSDAFFFANREKGLGKPNGARMRELAAWPGRSHVRAESTSKRGKRYLRRDRTQRSSAQYLRSASCQASNSNWLRG
jgi:hypothetical protein